MIWKSAPAGATKLKNSTKTKNDSINDLMICPLLVVKKIGVDTPLRFGLYHANPFIFKAKLGSAGAAGCTFDGVVAPREQHVICSIYQQRVAEQEISRRKAVKSRALTLAVIILCIALPARAEDFDELIADAEGKYEAREYAEALDLYVRAFEAGDPHYLHFYDAACTAALSDNADAAFDYLHRSVEVGLLDAEWLSSDTDLENLKSDRRWDGLIAAVAEKVKEVTAALPESHEGGTVIELPPPAESSDMSVEEALWSRRSVRNYEDIPVSLAEVSQLLWAAYGLTYPVEGAPPFLRGGLRTAPSAGARYPLEVYLVARNVEGLAPGVYWYKSETHELVTVHGEDRWEEVKGAAFYQSHFETAAAAIVYSAVFERNTEIYAERGRERYVCMDLGHSAENVYLQAQVLSVGTCAVGAFGDLALKLAVGMTGAEEPLYIMPLGKVERGTGPVDPTE
jgi:SagB-type dehydrogenase family enzyme